MDIFSRCHPAVSFLFFLGAIGGCILLQHPGYLLCTVAAALLYACLLVGMRAIRLVAGFAPFLLLIALINPLFSTGGQNILFHIFSKPYTLEALIYGIVNAAMFLGTVLWFACYSHVMTNDKFTSLFSPLMPSISLLLVMVLRMIPRFAKKIRQISTARRCIGFGEGKRFKNGARILSAVTDDALEGSITMADSMRARGYGQAKRTSFRLYRMRTSDWLLLLALSALLLCTILAGRAQVRFFPVLQVQNVSWGFVAYGLYVFLPSILYCKEAIRWRILRSKI